MSWQPHILLALLLILTGCVSQKSPQQITGEIFFQALLSTDATNAYHQLPLSNQLPTTMTYLTRLANALKGCNSVGTTFTYHVNPGRDADDTISYSEARQGI
jgi:hypothetical protein